MSDISEVTGLPLLPEGMFWRVRQTSDGHFGSYKRGFIVEIIERTMTISYTERRFLKIFRRQPHRTEHLGENTIAARWINVSYFAPSRDDLENGEPGPQVSRVRDVTLEELTPELILETAEKVMDAYRDRLKAEKLLGDYPPLKLEKEVTE